MFFEELIYCHTKIFYGPALIFWNKIVLHTLSGNRTQWRVASNDHPCLIWACCCVKISSCSSSVLLQFTRVDCLQIKFSVSMLKMFTIFILNARIFENKEHLPIKSIQGEKFRLSTVSIDKVTVIVRTRILFFHRVTMFPKQPMTTTSYRNWSLFEREMSITP